MIDATPGGKPEALRASVAARSNFLPGGEMPNIALQVGWGYYPSGGVGLILLIVLILALTGHG